jgi:hypothetical protein
MLAALRARPYSTTDPSVWREPIEERWHLARQENQPQRDHDALLLGRTARADPVGMAFVTLHPDQAVAAVKYRRTDSRLRAPIANELHGYILPVALFGR